MITVQIRATRAAKTSLRSWSVPAELEAVDKGEFSHTRLGDRRKKKLCTENKETHRTQRRDGKKLKVTPELSAAEDEPEEFGVEEQDSGGDDPRDDDSDAGVSELAHLAAVARELDQRDDGERQLEAKNDLAENEQRSDFAFARYTDDKHGGKNGERARNKAAEPRLQTNLEEAFHHDLAGERASEGGVLSGSEKGAGKDGAGEAHA